MCLWTRRPSLCARAVDAQVQVSSCFCRCTKDLAGFIVTFIFTTILRILRHVFAQLPHGLQLAPVIAAVSRIHRGVHDWLLVHALLHLSMAAGGLLVIFWLFWHSREEPCKPRPWMRILLGQLAVGGVLSSPIASWNHVLPTHNAGEAPKHSCGLQVHSRPWTSTNAQEEITNEFL